MSVPKTYPALIHLQISHCSSAEPSQSPSSPPVRWGKERLLQAAQWLALRGSRTHPAQAAHTLHCPPGQTSPDTGEGWESGMPSGGEGRDRQKGRRAGCDTPSTPSNTAPRAPEPGAHPTAARPATAPPPRSLLPPICSKTIAPPASAAAASGSDTAGMRGLGKAHHSGEGHERGWGSSKMSACNNYQHGYLAEPDTSFWIKCRTMAAGGCQQTHSKALLDFLSFPFSSTGG
ncbi:hypothetical protein H8959_002384 [Pygathrix nigripes]